MPSIILGLGSNIGDRVQFLKQAITLLESRNIIDNIKLSKLYESEALVPHDAPRDWNKKFINLAISGYSLLSPRKLLEEIKIIEAEIGRLDRGFWSPREIDIDILIYGDENINSKDLTIPHRYLVEREFVILPLNDLVPNWVYPRQGIFFNKTISDILKRNYVNNNQCKILNEKIEL